MTKQETLQAACDAIVAYPERLAIDALIDAARINADDALTEGTITLAGYEACFLESLLVLLSSRDACPAIVAWFADNGIEI